MLFVHKTTYLAYTNIHPQAWQVLARLAEIPQPVLLGLARLADIPQPVLLGLARLANICQPVLLGLARLADISQRPFFTVEHST
jgi:hypothetical protein